MKPIVLEVIDDSGNVLFREAVEFQLGMNVQDILERAFVEKQAASPDPLPFTVQYYGYSTNASVPGYLGYEVENFFSKYPTDPTHFWLFSINDQPSDHGIDTTYPGPGDRATFRYATTSAAARPRNAREQEVALRRRSRT